MLAFDLRSAPKVSVAPEKVEGVENQPILPACGKFGLKFGEVGSACVDDYYFPIDDGLPGNVESSSNGGEAFGPVQPGPGVDLLATAVDVNLNAISIELDLMKPLVTFRRRRPQRCKLGLNEARHLSTL